MKISNIFKVAVVAVPLFLTSCHSSKKVVKDVAQPVSAEQLEQSAFLEKVNDNSAKPQFVTSKLKFSIEYGPQQVSLTGNLRMKRDDVIQLQLMELVFMQGCLAMQQPMLIFQI